MYLVKNKSPTFANDFDVSFYMLFYLLRAGIIQYAFRIAAATPEIHREKRTGIGAQIATEFQDIDHIANGSANFGQKRPGGSDNKFEEMLLNDLIPEIDAHYRTIPARESRALTGLSMGAGQAQRIGFNNLDVFASIGAFSGGAGNFDINTSFSGVFKDARQFNDKVKLYWIGCGTLDRAYNGAKILHNTLTDHEVIHVWHEMDGSHEWQVWRHHIYEFAQKVFK